VAQLENNGITFFQKPAAGDMLNRHLIKTPDGHIISILNNIEHFFKKPEGPTMLRMAQQDFFAPDKYVNQVCGMFGEFAHPVKDLEASIEFWQKFGFVTTTKFQSPYPWAILTDGQAVVGLHQTKDFDKPVITFFASDSKDKIARLVENGLTNYREKGNSSNIILTTPEKQEIFLFKLGM
jgi:predicted enzyme related to lactoylglutathione lyase